MRGVDDDLDTLGDQVFYVGSLRGNVTLAEEDLDINVQLLKSRLGSVVVGKTMPTKSPATSGGASVSSGGASVSMGSSVGASVAAGWQAANTIAANTKIDNIAYSFLFILFLLQREIKWGIGG
jgi:hypothetical protein